MPGDTPPDLGETFRELVTTWERDFNAFANQLMGTESFSRAMNSAQKSTLGVQQMFSDAMARHFAAMNLPSRQDIVHLAETLQEVVRRLERIEAQMQAQPAPLAAAGTPDEPAQGNVVADAAAPAGPRRTRRPPAAYLAS